MLRLKRKNLRGDTIVEVMVAAALIMVALGGGYALSRQGLRQSTDNSLRSQALNYGRTQVEFIKNVINNIPASQPSPICSSPITLLDNYRCKTPFCIVNTGEWQDAAAANSSCKGYSGDKTSHNTPFTVNNTYDSASKTFTVTVTWLPLGTIRATDTQKLTLVYRDTAP